MNYYTPSGHTYYGRKYGPTLTYPKSETLEAKGVVQARTT
jgi:hypothetical protein